MFYSDMTADEAYERDEEDRIEAELDSHYGEGQW